MHVQGLAMDYDALHVTLYFKCVDTDCMLCGCACMVRALHMPAWASVGVYVANTFYIGLPLYRLPRAHVQCSTQSIGMKLLNVNSNMTSC